MKFKSCKMWAVVRKRDGRVQKVTIFRDWAEQYAQIGDEVIRVEVRPVRKGRK